ncbi:MAG: cation transporter [Alphaproteobacteria bacterium]|nr:cation transporter [Alphaproteobacteria bacterium]
MTHHHHHHGLTSASGGDRRLIIAIGINVLLTVAQIIGGVFSGSLALIADAIHNLSDAAALAIALIARRIARVPADDDHTFGHGRAELIAAVFNLSWLIFIGFFLIVEAIKRLIDPQPVEGWTVVIVAGVALAVDLWTVFLTYRMAQSSMNIRAAFIHNMSDALASLGVIIGGVLILTFDWHFVDAIVTLAIAGYILAHAGIEIPKAIHILMQGVPKDLDVDIVTDDLKQVEGVINIRHVHIWHIDEHLRSFEGHILVADPGDMESVKLALRKRLADDFDITHSTLEFEFETSGQTA